MGAVEPCHVELLPVLSSHKSQHFDPRTEICPLTLLFRPLSFLTRLPLPRVTVGFAQTEMIKLSVDTVVTGTFHSRVREILYCFLLIFIVLERGRILRAFHRLKQGK